MPDPAFVMSPQGPIPAAQVRQAFAQCGFEPPPGMSLQDAFILLLQLLQEQQGPGDPVRDPKGIPEHDIPDPTDPRAKVRPEPSTFDPDGKYRLRVSILGYLVSGLNEHGARHSIQSELKFSVSTYGQRCGAAEFERRACTSGANQARSAWRSWSSRWQG